MVRKATPRNIRKTAPTEQQTELNQIEIPPQVSLEARQRPPKKLRQVNRGIVETKSSLLIIINAYKRRKSLQRCLASLLENSPGSGEGFSDWRLIVVDDGNSLGRSLVLKEMFGERGQLLSPQQRLGRGLSKNRAIEIFRAYAAEETLLLVDDSVVFQHPDLWWRIAQTLQHSKREVLFLRTKEGQYVDKLGVNSYEHHLAEVSTAAVILRRTAVREPAYVESRGIISNDFTEYLKAISPNQYVAVPNTLHALQDVEIVGEDWESVSEKKRLYESVSGNNPNNPVSSSHRIPDFDTELRTLKVLGEKTLGRIVRYPRSSEASNGNLGPKYPGFAESAHQRIDETITIIIGHRGKARLGNLLLVLRQIHGLSTRPLIIVVEQDSEPLCKEAIEPWVDDYMFIYSRGLYNRGWGFNVGVQRAKSFIVVLHDNDLLVPESFIPSIEQHLKKFDTFLTWGSIDYLDQDSSVNPFAENVVVTHSVTNSRVHGGSIAARRDFFLEIGGFDERLFGWGAEDDIFYVKASRLGKLYTPSRKGGNRLIHLWHPYEIKRNPQGTRNYEILNQYCHMDLKSLRASLGKQGEIGNPMAGMVWEASPGLVIVSRKSEKRLHVVYDVVGWAYYNRAVALKRNSPPGWIVSMSDSMPIDLSGIDVLFILPYGKARDFRKRLNRTLGTTRLVGGMNVGWGRRAKEFQDLYQSCDHIIVNNLEFYNKAAGEVSLEKVSWISNGVDREIFKLDPTVSEPGNRVLWTGSTYHAVLKGYDLLRNMVGPLRAEGFNLELNRVDSHGKVKSLAQMADWYRGGFAYVVFSESEGTPNPALECASMGIPLISTKVGNMPELIQHGKNSFLLEDRKVESLLENLTNLRENWWEIREKLLEDIQKWDWRIVAQNYFELFDRITEKATT